MRTQVMTYLPAHASNSTSYSTSVSFLTKTLVFLTGFFLGHPLVPDPAHGESRLLAPAERVIFVDFVIAFLILVFVISHIQKRGIRWPRYTPAFWAFLLSCLLSVIFSPYFPGPHYAGLFDTLIYSYLFVASVVLYNLFSDESIRRVAVWGVIAGAVSCIILSYSGAYFGVLKSLTYSGRLQGTFRNPKQMAIYLFYICVLLFPLFFFHAGKIQRILILFIIVVTPYTLFITCKRSGMAAYGLLALLMVLYLGMVYRRVWLAFAIILGIGVGYFAFNVYIYRKIPEREKKWIEGKMRVLINPEEETRLGFAMKDEAFLLFQERPLTGAGIGLAPFSKITKYEIHNAYLKLLGEGGMIMFICGIWLFIVMGLLGPGKSKGIPRRDVILIQCYRLAFISILLLNIWGWSLRRREFWFVIAFIEALKMWPLGNEKHKLGIGYSGYGENPQRKYK